jgi:hypothetical protein
MHGMDTGAHQALASKVHSPPQMYKVIKWWLILTRFTLEVWFDKVM